MAIDRVYWDSMVFIHRMQRKPEYISELELITMKAEASDLLIVTSVFTTAEVAMVSDSESDEAQEDMIVKFFENPYIRRIPVTNQICTKAREVLRLFKYIGGKDAIHVATAILTPGITVMHSYEKKLIDMTGKLPGSSLVIQRPKVPIKPVRPEESMTGLFKNEGT